ncbi:MAG: protein kinase [Verrucomicrobia bacterium]|nr:protein kinase [Verrucomicrobiota bacterium]
MDYAFHPAYFAALSSANERTQPGGLTLFSAQVTLDKTHATVSDHAVLQAREGFIREALTQTGGQMIDSKGDWLFVVFLQPHEAVRAALILKSKLAAWAKSATVTVTTQIGIHAPAPQDFGVSEKRSTELFATDFAVCQRFVQLCGNGEVYVTQRAFDQARETLDYSTLNAFEHLLWANHGPYIFPGIDLDVELGHIQPDHLAQPVPPAESEFARPHPVENNNMVWGWRPAPATRIPRTRWVLDQKIRNGWFGEVWSAKEEGTSEKRMIECCFRTDKVELLAKESETMSVIKRKLTENRNVLRIFDISLEKPPFFILFEHFEGKDLKTWAGEAGGAASIPFSTRLELVAQVASGLQGVSDAKLVHKTLTPDHILVMGTGQTLNDLQVKITNLSIGHIGQCPSLKLEVPEVARVPEPPQEVPEPATETPEPAVSSETEDAPQKAPLDETQMYTAPEVIAGRQATIQSDIYSVGVLLCQFVLGNLSELLSPERVKDVVAGLKRDALVPCFSENPAERPDNPGKITQELRNLIKDRESRSAQSADRSRRRKIEAIVSVCFAIVAVVVLSVLGPKYWPSKKSDAPVPKAVEGTTEDSKTRIDPNRRESSDARPDYNAIAKETTTDGPGSTSGNPTRKPSKKTEPETFGIATLKYLIFPLCVVIVLGTLIQQFGPGLLHWFHNRSHHSDDGEAP